ncbi:MAG: Ig-like domain repeat protein [Bifidobacteriaceae bacterium]|jgi:hypothetical protein|nr:Ig-like domain repeat protein [Bifidobacteriaceae bacterium]
MIHSIRRTSVVSSVSAALALSGMVAFAGPVHADCTEGLTLAGPSLVLVGEQVSYSATLCQSGVAQDVTAETVFASSRPSDRVSGSRLSFEVRGLRIVTGTRGGAASAPLRVIAVLDAPQFVTQPALSTYSPKVGAPLSVTPGQWEPGGSRSLVAYRWLADGAPIPGATAATFTPSPAQLGKRLAVTVTVSHPETFSPGALTTGLSDGVGPGDGPTFGVEVVGTGQVDTAWQAVAAIPEGWGSPTYQWRRHGVDIPGAVSAGYTATAADVGAPITVRVSAARAAYVEAIGVSGEVTAIVGAASVQPVAISGTPAVGQTLTATGAPAAPWTVSYQWLRAGKPIAGATGAAYKLAVADAGQTVSVEARVGAEGHETATWSPEVKVAKVASTVTVKPSAKRVSANAKVRLTITVKAKGVSKPAGKIRVKIDKKTKTYTLKAAKKGKLTVTLPAQKRGAHTIRVAFLGSSQVAKKPARAFKLTVS